MLKDSKIYVAGHRGLVGSAIVRHLEKNEYTNLLFRTRDELDLRDPVQVNTFFEKERPEYVFLAAAKVGGIHANNTCPADFIYDNILIQTNVIHAAYTYGVSKLLFLGSSCIYPKECPQPMKEDHLLSGKLEPTNEAYALAKISGIIMCQSYNRQYGTNFISAMPTNMYGPNDNYNLENSHVLPALIRKCHEAKINNESEIELWGTGKPRREFLYADDLADACIFLMNNYDESEVVNIGSGTDISIKELAELVARVVGFKGSFRHNLNKPDGTMLKLMDVSKINTLGWKASINLPEGIAMAYNAFQADYEKKWKEVAV